MFLDDMPSLAHVILSTFTWNLVNDVTTFHNWFNIVDVYNFFKKTWFLIIHLVNGTQEKVL